MIDNDSSNIDSVNSWSSSSYILNFISSVKYSLFASHNSTEFIGVQCIKIYANSSLNAVGLSIILASSKHLYKCSSSGNKLSSLHACL